jgi:hypothetical protein
MLKKYETQKNKHILAHFMFHILWSTRTGIQ